MPLLRRLRPFFIIAALLVLASLALEHINGRFWLNDFRVYYMAADNMRHGLPVYGEVFGEDTGLYKYAPVVLYFFQPYTFLSFHLAGVLHFLLIGVLMMACFAVIERSLSHLIIDLPRPALRAFLGLLCIAVLLVRELHMGNINMGLILLAALGVERFIANDRRTAGILWGVVWLIKPYLLLMIVPLVIRREWRVLRTGAITMLVGLLVPLLLEGPSSGWELTREWGHSMLYHTQVMASPDHLTAILGKYTGVAPSPVPNAIVIAIVGLLLSVFTWRNTLREKLGHGSTMARSFELWMAMAIVPLLVITDQQHFMFSLPLILYILAYLFTRKDIPVLVFFLLSMILYGTRSSDLWGRALENKMVGYGVLGSGNILLMLVAWAVWRSWRWHTAKP
ncbi:MAG: DUF2029 domain-containing protein [Flavobacteriales bacterium]|nr:DUF2029 domain-containing protein [Flavobacteriales bacterium]